MFFLYFIIWVIFNGAFTLEICALGLIVAGALFWFTCKYLDYSVAKEKKNIKKIFRFIKYVLVLVKEIVKANLTVIPMILSEKEEPVPVVVHFTSNLESKSVRALLANAITLTPGTITVTLEGSDYQVHCLDESLAEGIDKSVFVDLLEDMEQK